MLLMTLSVLVSLSPRTAALSNTWTSDVDFNQSGAVFNGVEVIGTGASAHVDLVKDDIDWANKNPPSPPSARYGPSSAFDSTHNVTILFGGYNGFDLYDTWKYDGVNNIWTRITTATQPSGREFAGMSYDPVQHVMVLFGGVNGSAGFLNDTWEFNTDTNTWTQYNPSPAPPVLIDTPLAYYPAPASRHILVGMDFSQAMRTWAYNAATHTWANRNPSGSLGIRTTHAMAYSPARDRLVVFGGLNPFPPPGTLLSDTREYNYATNSWANIGVSGPSARSGHMMTYRPGLPVAAVLLFGGGNTGGPLSDTWEYTGSWQIRSTANSPGPRQYSGFTFDTKADVAVLFGGYDGNNYFQDTWTLGAAYRSAGRYTSPVFDSGASNTVWGNIWWNATPANQPPNTFLHFWVATSNSATGPWSYTGPACSSPPWDALPAVIDHPCYNNREYITFLADFGTFDGQVTPTMQDVTITYTVPIAPPYIVNTNPYNIEFGVQIDRPIWVNFSKSMDTTTVTWTLVCVNPGPPTCRQPALNGSWANNNKMLRLDHQAMTFTENAVYRVTISGTDTIGLALVQNPNDPNVTNPWVFITEKIFPWITNTVPPNLNPPAGTDISTTADVRVDFSEPMDTSSLFVTLTPPDVTFTPAWSSGNRTVILSHAAFAICREYRIGVNATDESNLPLDNNAPSAKPNPWTFQTHCPNPFITSQVPSDDGQQVPLTARIIVDFSEPMAISTVNVGLVPGAGTLTKLWSNGNRHLEVTHSANFVICTKYTVTITGNDADENLPLIDNPFNSAIKNPWSFMPTCNNPYIVWTKPADGDTNVSLDQEIQIFFSTPPPPGTQMDQNSLQYSVSPLLSYREIGKTWDVGTLVHITHTPFRECTHYTITVTQANDQNGNPLVPGLAPNPWSFDTICVSPYVTSTDPANDSALILVTQPVVVDFNHAMDTGTVFAQFTPSVTGLVYTWSNGDTRVTITHNDFVGCTPYQAFVDGNDLAGNALMTGQNTPGVPNPWVFTTRCPGFYIVRTDPADQQTDVAFTASVVVEFSQAANPATFQITFAPSAGTTTTTWSAGNTIATTTHSSPFTDCTMYQATVSARDSGGNPLINVSGSKPNPWNFRAHCVAPYIVSTNPAANATGVSISAPIIVTFSEPMVPSSLRFTISPTITLTSSMSGGNTILTLSHTASFAPNTQYCVTITQGWDVDLINLVPGPPPNPAPNPWCFTTGGGVSPPGGLNVARASPNVVLTWRFVSGTTYYIYSATSRFAAWPWPQLGTSTTGSFIHNNGDADTLCHYYIVRANVGGSFSANSTMGFKCPVQLAYSAARPNIHWISIPYHSKYHSAKDITDDPELGPRDTKIDVVAKWNPATQSSIVWAWFRGGWRGTNFPINPGDGIYVSAHSTFTWIFNGTDAPVAHTFTAYPSPNANVNWFSLPWTLSYRTASDIVRDIEGGLGPTAHTKIDLIAIWNPVSQTTVTFQWTPAGWTGTDFPLSMNSWPDGATGIYFHVVSTFTWTPTLVTPEVP